jgi:hypothetical protein
VLFRNVLRQFEHGVSAFGCGGRSYCDYHDLRKVLDLS